MASPLNRSMYVFAAASAVGLGGAVGWGASTVIAAGWVCAGAVLGTRGCQGWWVGLDECCTRGNTSGRKSTCLV